MNRPKVEFDSNVVRLRVKPALCLCVALGLSLHASLHEVVSETTQIELRQYFARVRCEHWGELEGGLPPLEEDQRVGASRKRASELHNSDFRAKGEGAHRTPDMAVWLRPSAALGLSAFALKS